MDEARFGQRGTLTDVWAAKGSETTARKQTRYEWVHLLAAVEPTTGVSSALLSVEMNTGVMNVFLKQIVREELLPKEHAIVVMDEAGRHTSNDLEVPEPMTILLLPPCSPELNPVERVWAYLRSHHIGNRAFAGYGERLDAGANAWRRLRPGILKSICRSEYPGAR